MASVKAGTVHVDVELNGIDKLKKKLASLGVSAGNDFGEKLSERAGNSFSKNMVKKVSDTGKQSAQGFMMNLSSGIRAAGPLVQTAVFGGLLVAATTMAPLIGAALGGGIIAALGAGVIAAGIFLVAKDPRIKAAGDELGKTVSKGLKKSAVSFVQPVLQSIGILKTAFLSLQPTIANIFGNLSPFVTMITRGLVGAFTGIVQGIQAISAKAGPIMQVLSGGLAAIGIAIGNVLKKFASDPKAMKGFADGLQAIITVVVGMIQIFGSLIAALSRMYVNITSTFTNIRNFISSTWSNIKTATNSFLAFIRSIPAVFSSVMTSAKNTVSSAAKAIVSAVSGLGPSMYQAGYNAMLGFFRGLSSMGSAVIGKARDIASSVVSTIKSALSIASPSKVMEQLGMWSGEGFVRGLDKSMPDLSSVSKNLGIPSVSMDFGSPKDPQMDKDSGSGNLIHIDKFEAKENEHPSRTAERLGWMLNFGTV